MRFIVAYEWHDALQDAVHERDPLEIERRVLRAEIAIFERVHSLCRIDSIETQALFDALKVLRLLRSSAHRATKSTLSINSQRKLDPKSGTEPWERVPEPNHKNAVIHHHYD
jgi:hypothetical protein